MFKALIKTQILIKENEEEFGFFFAEVTDLIKEGKLIFFWLQSETLKVILQGSYSLHMY